MKPIIHSAFRLTLALTCLGLAGCQSQKNVAPVANGYEEVTHTTHTFIDEPPPPRTAFQYRGPDGRIIPVWPALYCSGEVIKGDLAIFVAEKAYLEEGSPAIHPRLFAMQPPGPPLDLTDEILWRWSKSAGKDFTRTLERFSLITSEELNGGLAVHLEFFSDDKDWPDRATLPLDWNQVAEIMRAVKTKGVVEKDVRWHTPFIGEKF